MDMIGNLLRTTQEELDAMLTDSSILEDRISDSSENPELLKIGNAWEGILFLLTGKNLEEVDDAKPPLVWALFSGQAIDREQHIKYGPAEYVTVKQVKEIDKALASITIDILKSRFDGKRMMKKGIYPEIWQQSDAFDDLVNHFTAMKAFYQQAAKQDKAVITFIN